MKNAKKIDFVMDMINRKGFDFMLTPEEVSLFEMEMDKMSDEDIGHYRFNIDLFVEYPMLKFLVQSLADVGNSSPDRINLQQDAFSYLMDNSPAWNKRMSALCP